MPDIQGIYYTHPETGEAGVWIKLKNRIVGRSNADMEALIAKQGTESQKIAAFIAAAEAYLNDGMTDRVHANTFFADWPQADIDEWVANPPQFYSVEGNFVLVQRNVVTINVLSLVPLRYQITVSRGASGGEIILG